MTHLSEAHRGEQLRRPVRLIAALLRGETLTRRRVAQLLGVQVATADRQLKVLRELPGVKERSRGELVFDRGVLFQHASFPAAVAACLTHGMASLFRGTSFDQGMRDSLEFVVSRTPRSSMFKDLERKFLFLAKGGDSSLPEAGKLLEELIEALLHGRRARIQYTRFSGKNESVIVEPLSIAVYEHQLYVLARPHGGELHPYRFSRISAVDVLGERFKYPSKSEYDPEQVFGSSLGVYVGDGQVERVTVKLTSAWRTYATTHRWHRSQQVRQTGAGVTITLQVRVTPELHAWVLAFGGDAEVLEPASLRAHVAKHARALARTYGPRHTTTSRAGGRGRGGPIPK